MDSTSPDPMMANAAPASAIRGPDLIVCRTDAHQCGRHCAGGDCVERGCHFDCGYRPCGLRAHPLRAPEENH